ncbi:hypothetical protein ACTA71_005911 [Dictyostelium dimigraforme]
MSSQLRPTEERISRLSIHEGEVVKEYYQKSLYIKHHKGNWTKEISKVFIQLSNKTISPNTPILPFTSKNTVVVMHPPIYDRNSTNSSNTHLRHKINNIQLSKMYTQHFFYLQI